MEIFAWKYVEYDFIRIKKGGIKMSYEITFNLTEGRGNPQRTVNKWSIPGCPANAMSFSSVTNGYHDVMIPLFRPFGEGYKADISIDHHKLSAIGDNLPDAIATCLSGFNSEERIIFFNWYKNNKLDWYIGSDPFTDIVRADHFGLFGLRTPERIIVKDILTMKPLAEVHPVDDPISDKITLVNMIIGEAMRMVKNKIKNDNTTIPNEE